MAKKKVFTVGMFIQELSRYDLNSEIDFGGLEFYRVKQFIIDPTIQIQFHQYMSIDGNGKISLTNPYKTNLPPTLKK